MYPDTKNYKLIEEKGKKKSYFVEETFSNLRIEETIKLSPN